jgi:alanine racemase
MNPSGGSTPTRREFIRTGLAAAAVAGAAPAAAGASAVAAQGAAGSASAASTPLVSVPASRSDISYEPWLEIDGAALRDNVRAIAGTAGGRPVLAVVKNNAYGLGIRHVGPLLDAAPEVAGLAVVKPDEARALRAAGVRKPILLMALADVETGSELALLGVHLAAFTDDAGARFSAIARSTGAPVLTQLYIDSGMGRMGLRADRALPWMAGLAASPAVRVEGMFTELAESDAYDDAQLARFDALVAAARERGIRTGAVHAMSSHALVFRPGAVYDGVRTGLVLYGAYPAGARELGRLALRPAFRLRARVVRVERIEAGDGVSYGRNYVAGQPTWIASLPVGHADGYSRQAVRGAEVLIDGRTYPVIGAVSASHAIIEVGTEQTVRVGDTATLVGPDHPSILPNEVAERAGISVYDVLMRLSPELPVRSWV